MKKATMSITAILVFLLFTMLGCVSSPTPSADETAKQFLDAQTEGISENQDGATNNSQQNIGQLPVRYQQPAYMLGSPDASSGDSRNLGEFSLPMGADVSTPAGPKPLGTIIGQIANMKNMSASYATDVDQLALVSVNIRADQDFFKAIDNVLRPLDYFYELEDNLDSANYMVNMALVYDSLAVVENYREEIEIRVLNQKEVIDQVY
jgi:hypothetical protein